MNPAKFEQIFKLLNNSLSKKIRRFNLNSQSNIFLSKNVTQILLQMEVEVILKETH